MSGAKRIPLHRAMRTVITPEAVAIYKQMRRLHCSCGPYPPGQGPHRKQCDGCSRWWSLHSQLDEALGPRKPWLWPHVPCPTKYPDRDGVLRRRLPLDHQLEVARRLREAARAQRNAERAEQPQSAVSPTQ
jgi:hypothetical protein